MAESKLTQEQRDSLPELYRSGKSTCVLAKEFGISPHSVYSHLKRRGVLLRDKKSISSKKTTGEQRENICKEYSNGESIIKLADKYGINYGRVYAILKNRKVSIRSQTDSHMKYKINKEYFSKIDSEDKAYFLGFLYADGSMDEKRHSLQITIQEDDKEVLEKFIKCIGEDRPIYYLKNRLRRPNEKDHVQLSISNTYLYKQLVDLGCGPKKSFTLEFPNISKELERHFIRGYFDGDGCWSFGKGKRAFYRSFTFISTKIFCEKVKEIFKKELDLESNIYKHSLTELYNFTVTKKKDLLLIGDWLYKDSNYFLKRKRDKFESNRVLLN